MKKIICSIGCIVFLLALSNVASAQVRPSTFSLTPYIGGYLFDHDQDLDNGPVYGISLGYNFTKYIGVEASGEYISTKLDFSVPHSQSTDVANFRLDGVLNLIPDGRLVPFVFAGVGYQTIDYPKPISNNASSAVDYGVGLKFFFTDELALRADVRSIHVFENRMNDAEGTLGISYYFGGPEPAPLARYVTNEKVVIIAAEPEAEEKVKAVAVEPKIVVLALEDVHFDFDKSKLKPEAKVILKRNIQLLKDNPDAQIRIAGYTSAAGTDEYNQKLSERRAAAVQEYLISEGIITPDRLSTIGYGKAHPDMYEAAPKEIYSKAAKANMRVLFEIVVK